MKKYYFVSILMLLTCCASNLDRSQTFAGDNQAGNAACTIKLFDAGGPEFPPHLLLTVSDSLAVVFHYDDKLTLSRQEKIIGAAFKTKVLPVLHAIPKKLIHSGGGNFSSPVDAPGYIVEITRSDGNVNRWGFFPDDYGYDEALVSFLNKLIRLTESE